MGLCLSPTPPTPPTAARPLPMGKKLRPFDIVCPASRGLSLHLARTLLQRTKHQLVVTARNDLGAAKDALLDGLPAEYEPRVTILKVDVTNEQSVASASTRIRSLFGGQHAQYVFSTPGVLLPERSPRQLDVRQIQTTLSTNLLGPLLLIKHFSCFLPTTRENPKTPAVWAHLSDRTGTIADNLLGGWYTYRASKAGLNSITKTFDLYLQQISANRAICVSLHPG